MVNYTCENGICFFDEYGEVDYNIVDNISEIAIKERFVEPYHINIVSSSFTNMFYLYVICFMVYYICILENKLNKLSNIIETVEQNSQDDNIDIINLKSTINTDISNKLNNIFDDIYNVQTNVNKIDKKIKKIKRRQKTIIKDLLETNKKAYNMLEESMEVCIDDEEFL
jgi:hypothetical protein